MPSDLTQKKSELLIFQKVLDNIGESIRAADVKRRVAVLVLRQQETIQ